LIAAPARFLLHGPSGSVGLDGPLTSFRGLSEAENAVREGTYGNIVAGAVPFDQESGTSSFYLGRRVTGRLAVSRRRTGRGHFVPDVIFNDTEIAGYIRLIDHVLPMLRSPNNILEKIVAARAERFFSTVPVDALQLYGRIVDMYPRVHSYLVEHLETPGVYTMGASPELFVKKTGDIVTMTPLAGTIPRDLSLPTPEDTARAHAELFTDKYLVEHRHLVEFMLKGLAPFCTVLDHPHEPELIDVPGVWHLGTPIRGRLTSPGVRVADLVSALHPSPAVCGIPQSASLQLITANESPRGYYGGLVGWLDSNGDCELYMALRGLDFDTRHGRLTLRAGGGIVTGSRLDVEFAETTAKLATMRRVLGITPLEVSSASSGSGRPVREVANA
jgi:isochorismate synthase